METSGFSLKSFLTGVVLFIIILKPASNADEEPGTKINILFIYEDPWTEKLFNEAKNYVDENWKELGIQIGHVHRFQSNNAFYPLDLTKSFCIQLDRFMASENPPEIAIDFTKTGINSEAVKVLLRAVQMPTVAGTFGQENDIREWRNLSPAEKQYLIQVSPPADLLIQSVRSLVDLQAMKSAAILYDNDYTMDLKCKTLLKGLPTRQLLVNLDFANLTGQVTRLVNVDIGNFFIASTPSGISEVLARASGPDGINGSYFSDEYSWFSMSLVDGLPRCSGCASEMSLVHLSPEPTNESYAKDFLYQSVLGKEFLTYTDFFYFDIVFTALRAVKLLKLSGEWNHDTSNNSCVNWRPLNGIRYPEINLNLFKAFEAATNESILPYHLEQNGRNYPDFRMKIQRLTFDPMSGTPKKLVNIGTWTAGVGKQELIQFEDAKDLVEHKAITVQRVVVVVQEPFVIRIENCTTEKDKYKVCFKGYCLEMLQEMSRRLGFNYTLREVNTGYGYMSDEPSHEWNGMVRELQDKTADIALGAMWLLDERMNAVDFTEPYYEDLVGIRFLMRKPKRFTNIFKFYTIMNYDIWLYVLGCYLASTIMIWMSDFWSPFSFKNNPEMYEGDDPDENRVFGLKESIWFTTTTLTPHGGGVVPKNLAGQLTAGTWYIFAFVLMCGYCANMAACMTLGRMVKYIETYDDLISQHQVEFAPIMNSSTWQYYDRMAHAEFRLYVGWKNISVHPTWTIVERAMMSVWDYPVSDTYTFMYQNFIETIKPPTNLEEALDRIRKYNQTTEVRSRVGHRGFALIDEATNIRWLTGTNCDLVAKDFEFSRKPYVIAVQKGSPLKDSLSRTILDLKYERYFEVLKEKWWSMNELNACPKDQFDVEGLSMDNVGGVFIILATGIVLSMLTLVWEFWWYRKRETVVVEMVTSRTSTAESELPELSNYQEKRLYISFYIASN